MILKFIKSYSFRFSESSLFFRRGGVVFLSPLFTYLFLSLWVVSPLAFADRLGF